MMERASFSFDPAALAAFAATLANLPGEEIRKAKKLFILNAIADFNASRASSRAMMIAMGIMCIIPIFLIVFIPGFIATRRGIEAARQKILNAMEVWREDLGTDYAAIRAQLGS